MSKRFANKVAVVTGGNSGIGLAAARAYLREGAQVAITGRSDTTLKAAQKELGAEALVAPTVTIEPHEIDVPAGFRPPAAFRSWLLERIHEARA